MDSRDITRALLAEGNEVLLHTAGLSMGHAIRGGEAVVIRAVPEQEIRFGNVVVFERNAQWVCHRVVRVRTGAAGRTLLTKGDSVLGFDDPVPAAAVQGRVLRVKDPGGDFRMDDWRGRCRNRLLAAASLAAWLLYVLYPWKGSLNRPTRASRAVWHCLGLPSRLLRRRPGSGAPGPES